MIKPVVITIGENPTPIWGMSNAERIRRIAGKQGLVYDWGDGPRLLVDARYVFDPPLLRHVARRPYSVVVEDGRPVIAHVPDPGKCKIVAEAMQAGAPLPDGLGLDVIVHEEGFTLYNDELRKREQPFLMRLKPENVRKIERVSYYAAYKGVTDILTKYLWPEWALALTRLAAKLRITPNMVTAIGAAFCLIAFWLFWQGRYWEGMAAGLVFMVLDTVDGKLARCTITSSGWGEFFDHGIDLVHPPFWWWAWGVGLSAWGLALSDELFLIVLAVIVGGYVLQRLIEGAFIKRFGMHIHVWQRIDSDFRLITARRNPNMVILLVGLIFQRPDIGLIAVAGWTALSLLFHFVRLLQAEARRRVGLEVASWLSA